MMFEEQSLHCERLLPGASIAPLVRGLVRRSHSVLVRGEYLENSIAAVKTTLVSTVQKKDEKQPNNQTKKSTKRLKYKQSLFFSEHWQRLTISKTPREGLSEE